MNARPVPPELMTLSGVTPSSKAKFPRIPKIVTPDKSEVKVSKVVTTRASL